MKVLKTTAAGLLVLLIVLAPPYLLIRYIGNPYPPEGLNLSAPLTDNAILGLIAVLVWILWAQLVLILLVEGYAALTDRAVDVPMPVFGAQQDLARALIAAIITTTVVAPVSMESANPADAAETTHTTITSTGTKLTGTSASLRQGSAPHHYHQVAAADPAGRDGSTVTADTPAQQQKVTETITVTAQRGDSLWSMAETYLGDGDRWSEIAAANSGQTMTDGVVFTSANQIRAGWHITIPGVLAATHHDDHTERYRVQAGDTLSDIAEDQLGDATRFPEIFAASRGVTQPDGQHLRDPDVIDVGWTVRIPRQARPRSGVTAEAADADDTAGRVGDGRGASRDRGDVSGDRGGSTGGSARQSPLRPVPPAGTKLPEVAAPRVPSTTSTPETPSESQSAAARRGGGGQDTAEAGAAHVQAPWVLMMGAGVVLAGGLLLGLRTRRRAQLRARRPGRAIAAPSRELSSVEATIAASTEAAATVEHMDAALRRLAAWCASERISMPTLGAVELTRGALVLHLTAPASLPAPWHDAAGDQLHWRAPLEHDATPDPADSLESAAAREGTDSVAAPYPLLVTVGSTAAGEVWLLNCEELGEVRVTGDADRGRDFTRYLLAELAMNPWSEQARVDCVAIGAEVAPMNPDRVEHHGAADLEETAGAAVADAVVVIDRAGSADGGPVTGRTGQLDEDVWAARMVVVDATAARGSDREAVGRDALQQLREVVRSHPGRTGTAVLLVGEEDTATQLDSGPAAVEIRLHSDGALSVPSVGLDLLAVGLSAEEAHGCAALLAQSEALDDVEIPVDDTVEDGWEAYVDTSGALRREHTVPRNQPAEELSEPVGSLLDAPTEAYVRTGAATAKDLERLAPQVPLRLRAEIEAKDPRLDQDVDDWFDDGCRRPRLVLLGPVTAYAYGRPLTKQKPYMAELLAYLASHRRNGVTAKQLASTFHITPEKAHSYTEILRAWLGINPRTGRHYLPHATKAPAAQVTGVGVYQLDEDVLVDRELFSRLRARGQARNTDGTPDLQRALSLVAGRPFDQLRVGGWEWLPALEPFDVSGAVADVAFLVTTGCLERGEVEQARRAADIATLVAPDADGARLSLAAVVEAEGDRVEAERIVREEICNRSDDGRPPTEVSERTRAIIRSRGWLADVRKTS